MKRPETSSSKPKSKKPIDKNHKKTNISNASEIIRRCLASTQPKNLFSNNRIREKDDDGGCTFRYKQLQHTNGQTPNDIKGSTTSKIGHKSLYNASEVKKKVVAPEARGPARNKQISNYSRSKANRTFAATTPNQFSKLAHKQIDDYKTAVHPGQRSNMRPGLRCGGGLTHKKEQFFNAYKKYNMIVNNVVDVEDHQSSVEENTGSGELYHRKVMNRTYNGKFCRRYPYNSLSSKPITRGMGSGNKSLGRNQNNGSSLYNRKVDKERTKQALTKGLNGLGQDTNLYKKQAAKDWSKNCSIRQKSNMDRIGPTNMKNTAGETYQKPTTKPRVERGYANNLSFKGGSRSKSRQNVISSFINKSKQKALRNGGRLVSGPRRPPEDSNGKNSGPLKHTNTRKKLLSEDQEKRISVHEGINPREDDNMSQSKNNTPSGEQPNNIDIVTMTSDNLKPSEGSRLLSKNGSRRISRDEGQIEKKLYPVPNGHASKLNETERSNNINSALNPRNSKAMEAVSFYKLEYSQSEENEISMDGSQSVHTFDSNKTKAVKLSRDMVLLKAELIKKIKRFIAERGSVPRTSLDFYHITKLLGEGSYGKVYLGRSVLTSKPVAIKCYEKSRISSEASFKRISQEIEIIQELNHPYIVKLYEIFENNKFIFSVLEYVDNCDLLTHLKSHGTFTEVEFLPLFRQLVEALEYVHSKGVLHRDIKLDNILLTKDGQAKICDFGVSCRMPTEDMVYEHIGTPAYLAPEIIRKQGYSGFKADIWSLGVTTLIALTGHVPFKGESIDELNHMILNNEVNFGDNCKISEQMKTVLKGMLIKNPSERYNFDQIASALNFQLNKHQEHNTIDDKKIVNKIMKLGFTKDQIEETFKTKMMNHIHALSKFFGR